MNAKRKPGAPADRLSAVLGSGTRGPEKPGSKDTGRSKKTPQRANTAAGSEEKARTTFYLPVSLVEAVRDATDALSGPPTRATLNSIVEDALRRELARLSRKHNGGEPFPARGVELRPGRRPG